MRGACPGTSAARRAPRYELKYAKTRARARLTSRGLPQRECDMTLNELSENELIALVGLLELVGESDSDIPEEEVDRISAVAAEVGADRYRAVANEVDRRFADEDEFKAFLSIITRKAARELIYETVFEAAAGGALDSREARLLEWLAKEWDIRVQSVE
jgi:hypothetical protein